MPQAKVAEPMKAKKLKQNARVKINYKQLPDKKLIAFAAHIIDCMSQNPLYQTEQLSVIRLHSKMRAMMMGVHEKETGLDVRGVKEKRHLLLLQLKSLAQEVMQKAELSGNSNMVIKNSGFGK